MGWIDHFIRWNIDVPRKPAVFFPKDRGGDAKEVQSQLNETLPIPLPLKKSNLIRESRAAAAEELQVYPIWQRDIYIYTY